MEIKYGRANMRLDFGTAIKLHNVRNYDPVWSVNTGYFVYDGTAWKGTSDVIPDGDTAIEVKSEEKYELVAGTVHRDDLNSKTSDYCFALSLVDVKGFITGGLCADKKSQILPFNELFKTQLVIVPK